MRTGVVREGDEIRLSSGVFTVATLSGGGARLVDAVGQHVVMPLPELLADPALELVSGSRPSLCSEEALAGLPEAAVERARWWERHIVEILTGRPQRLCRERVHGLSLTQPNSRCDSASWPSWPSCRP